MATICRQFVLPLAVLALVAIQSGLAGHAHSFAHFHGPVEGPGHEIVVHNKHGHHQVDYVAHPKYEFAYGVEDHHTGDYHGQKEHRDGKTNATTLRKIVDIKMWRNIISKFIIDVI